jgi:hypothetical protein
VYQDGLVMFSRRVKYAVAIYRSIRFHFSITLVNSGHQGFSKASTYVK